MAAIGSLCVLLIAASILTQHIVAYAIGCCDALTCVVALIATRRHRTNLAQRR